MIIGEARNDRRNQHTKTRIYGARRRDTAYESQSDFRRKRNIFYGS